MPRKVPEFYENPASKPERHHWILKENPELFAENLVSGLTKQIHLPAYQDEIAKIGKVLDWFQGWKRLNESLLDGLDRQKLELM